MPRSMEHIVYPLASGNSKLSLEEKRHLRNGKWAHIVSFFQEWLRVRVFVGQEEQTYMGIISA